MTPNHRPVHEIRLGRIRASIWANRGHHQDVWYSVSMSRVYRDGNAWKDTTSFGRDDLPLVAKAADLAYAWLWSQVASSDREGRRHANP